MGDPPDPPGPHDGPCAKCNKVFYLNSKIKRKIKCSVCNDYVHPQCAEIPKAIADVLLSENKSNNITYSCNKCLEENDNIFVLNKKIENLEQLIQILINKQTDYEKEIERLKNKPSVTSPFMSPSVNANAIKRKWTDLIGSDSPVATSPRNNKVQRKELHTQSPLLLRKKQNEVPILVIKPKAKDAKITENDQKLMQEQVKSAVNPLNDPVKSLRFSAKGNIIVQCTDAASIQSIKEKIAQKLNNDYVVDKPSESDPLFKIVGINETDFSDNDKLLNDLRSQNDDVLTNDSVLQIMSAKKFKNSHSAVIKTDVKTLERILNKRKLYVGYSSCRVFENFNGHQIV